MLAHGIEKGLSFREVRIPFFLNKLSLLCELLNEALSRDTLKNDARWLMISSALKSYLDNHKDDQKVSAHYATLRSALQANTALPLEPSIQTAGSSPLSFKDFSDFFQSRSSVRDYTSKEVPQELITEAVQVAIKAPSVCNRQPWRVKILEKPEDIKSALSLQNGNIGFGHEANKVIIIGSDLRAFVSPIERNQAFIETGLFAMSFILALHAKGIGSCCLNWCVTPKVDKKLHDKLALPEWFKVGFFLSVGYPREGGVSPRSHRKTADDIIIS